MKANIKHNKIRMRIQTSEKNMIVKQTVRRNPGLCWEINLVKNKKEVILIEGNLNNDGKNLHKNYER